MSTPPNPLTELAERVEKLTGPCRETDGAIKLAFAAQLFAAGVTKDDAVRILGGDLYADPMPYTASLDAAMTLVPEDMEWEAGTAKLMDIGWARVVAVHDQWKSKASTPVLALTAASLRARAASENSHG